jgi:glycolate oxidase iron-sulfur subunit
MEREPATDVPAGPVVTPAFDAHHPPDAALIGDCVHCGFCLPSCPTYVLWGEEMDSPRGRIYLMEQGVEGEPLTPAMVQHIDQCLGCLACVTACPSGVQYDKLIETTRAQVERRYPRPRRHRLLHRLVYGLFPRPHLLRLLRGPLRLYQRLGLGRLARRLPMPEPLRAMESLAPPLGRKPAIPARTPAAGAQPRRTVAVLLGCVQREFFPQVNVATVGLLAAEGCDVQAPAEQGCCGALSAHAGREEEALRYLRRLIAALAPYDPDAVVVNAAGCGSHLKQAGWLLRDDPAWRNRAEAFAATVRDLSEFVAELGPVAPRRPLPLRVAYQDACHLSHGQGVRAQPRALLRQIPGLEIVELPEAEICCGSAGTYNIVQPGPARELADRKAEHVRRAHPDLLVTANPGCAMQISAALRRAGVELPVAHVAEVLDAAVRGTALRQLSAGTRQRRHAPADTAGA